MEVYKYKVVKSVKILDEAKLNAVGRAGWQLCVLFRIYMDMYII